MTISFDDQVAVVTGGGRGLGRSYARALAARGARVAIADLGADAAATADEISADGGIARAYAVDVTDFASVEHMVAGILSEWGRVDIAINNAGILRDKTFAKKDLADFRAVLDVHLMGSVHVCKAVWQPMRERQYGRILLTGSSSGMYGIFGQSNYGAAKAAMLGLMNALHLEGQRYGIHINTITPTASTHMTAGLFDPDLDSALSPEAVAPAALYLISTVAPSAVMLAAGAGTVARIYVTETEGVSLPPAELTPEAIAAHFEALSNPANARTLANGMEQTKKLVATAFRGRPGAGSSD